MCRAVSPHMRKAKGGRIINIASGTAFKGAPGMLHYIASKGAILSMTRSLATEFGDDNVLVNAVSPGLTITESVAEAGHVTGYFQEAVMARRIPQRPAVPEDVANVFLIGRTSGGERGG